jgi:hypothetical protein
MEKRWFHQTESVHGTYFVDFSRLKLTVFLPVSNFVTFQYLSWISKHPCYALVTLVPVIALWGTHQLFLSKSSAVRGLACGTNNGLTKLTTSQELRASKAWGLDVQFSDQTGPWMKPNTCAVGHK